MLDSKLSYIVVFCRKVSMTIKLWIQEIYLSMCGWALWHWKVRAILYRLIGISISKCSAIHSGCFLSGNHLMIGDNSYINRRCTIDCKHGNVLIGNNVGVAFDVKMYTTEHNYENPNKRTGFVSGADIIIKDGCWIGGAV